MLTEPTNGFHALQTYNGIRLKNFYSFARYEYSCINDSVYDFNYHLFVQRVHRRVFTAAKQTDSAVEHKQKLRFYLVALSWASCTAAAEHSQVQVNAVNDCGITTNLRCR